MKLSLGIEINEEYLKLVAVKSLKLKPPKLFDCIVERISSFSDEQITSRITEIIRAWKIKPYRIALCLPRSFVTVRNLHLPSQDRQEIMQMINLHIGRVVPYKKEEIVFGYQSLGIDEMGYSKELVAIVHIDIVRRQSRILEKAGLFIDDISLSSFGTWQWVIKNYQREMNQNDLYLILDIDSIFTDFIICSRTNLLFTRNIPIKVNTDLNSSDVTKFIGEVKQSLVIFQNEEMNKKPVSIFLSGSEKGRELYKVAQDELDIPVKLIKPPYSEDFLQGKHREIPRDASLIAATELVLEDNILGLSFVLPEIQIRKSLKEKTKELTIMATLFVYFSSMIVLMFLGRLYSEGAYLKKLNQRTEVIKKDVGDLLNQTRKIELIIDFLRMRRLPLLFISELQKVIPDEISVDYISLDEANKVTLRGQASQLSNVFKFVSTLEQSKYFKDVSTKYTRTKKVKDKEINNFEIEFQFLI